MSVRAPGVFVRLALSVGFLAAHAAGLHDPTELVPRVGVPGTFTHVPAGAYATGTNGIQQVGNEYHLYFVGADETIDYMVDLADDEVQDGLIRVHETQLTGGAVPIARGGLAWRPASGPVVSPVCHAEDVPPVLYHVGVDQDSHTLVLSYREEDSGGTVLARKTYEFRIVGKVLRIRAFIDPTVNSSHLGNYDGLQVGPTDVTPNPEEQHIPYMDGVPLLMYEDANEDIVFQATFIDWNRSNASEVEGMAPEIGDLQAYGTSGTCAYADAVDETPSGDPDSINFWFGSTYYEDDEGDLNAPVDETLNLIVTRVPEHTFPVPQFSPSPYRDVLAGRMIFCGSNDGLGAWNAHQYEWESFLDEFGMDDVAGYMFNWEKWSLNLLDPDRNQALILGCTPDMIEEQSGYTTMTIAGTSVQVHGVDPEYGNNPDNVDEQFGDMMDASRERGFLVGLYQMNNSMDQHGQSGAGLFQPGEGSYPSIPLAQSKWVHWNTFPIKGYGLLAPSATTGYDASRVVRDENGDPKFGWNTNNNLENTSWEGDGHEVLRVSPSMLLDNYIDRMSDTLIGKYEPRAVFVDATTDVPSTTAIDQIVDSGRADRIWMAIDQTRAALADQKERIEGPLFGENSHVRFTQWDSYEAGLWDGRQRGFPIDYTWSISSDGQPADRLKQNSDSWVLPDYELRAVAPRTGGDHGMGFEFKHVKAIQQLTPGSPFDGFDGNDSTTLFDSWCTDIVTYGHSAFTRTNGRSSFNYLTVEGYLRQYYLLAGLQRAYRASTIETVNYLVPLTSTEMQLPEALAAAHAGTLDLKNCWLRIAYDSGLQIWANHDVEGGSDWYVADVPDHPPGGSATTVDFNIPPDGFVASDGNGLMVFSATPATDALRIDYARVPGRWEMISNREYSGGATFGAFPDYGDLTENFDTGTVIRNDVHGLLIGAKGGLWNSVTGEYDYVWSAGGVPLNSPGVVETHTTTAPSSTGLVIQTQGGATSVAVGRKLGVTATLQLGTVSGATITRDVTSLVDWTITPASGTPVRIDKDGALEGLAVGSFTLSATYVPASETSSNLSLSVVSGIPTASAGSDQTVAAGAVVTLAGSVSDTESGASGNSEPLASYWNPGDDSAFLLGPTVEHVYHVAGTYTATIAVTDRDGNMASDDATITVTSAGNQDWKDGFGGPVVDGWTWDIEDGAWGLVNGMLRNGLKVTPATQASPTGLSVSLPTITTSILFDGGAPSGGEEAGIMFRKTSQSALPGGSGFYYASLSKTGVVTLYEDTTSMQTTTISSFNAATAHTLKVETYWTGVRLGIRVFVDNMSTHLLSVLDTTPQTGGYLGLGARLAGVSFDDFTVTH